MMMVMMISSHQQMSPFPDRLHRKYSASVTPTSSYIRLESSLEGQYSTPEIASNQFPCVLPPFSCSRAWGNLSNLSNASTHIHSRTRCFRSLTIRISFLDNMKSSSRGIKRPTSLLFQSCWLFLGTQQCATLAAAFCSPYLTLCPVFCRVSLSWI